MNYRLATLAILGLLGGCQSNATPHTVKVSPDAKRLLIIANGSVSQSVNLAQEYARRRGVPSGNIILVNTSESEEVSQAAYNQQIEKPVRRSLKTIRGPIDFFLIMKGVPIRIHEGGFCVDAALAAMDLPNPRIHNLTERDIRRSVSPYFNRNEHFSYAKFGMYLATRLDGYTYEQATRLIDLSIMAKKEDGPFLFDEAANRNGADYSETQHGLVRAADILRAKGKYVVLDAQPEFVALPVALAGYTSWGSNDGRFKRDTYHQLRFKPGALAETFVSTSARTFSPTIGGQSLIADLIEQSVTGVKGYVSEPYEFALAKPEILFDRYTSGFNLAESFYMASMVVKWKDIVIGDPLCSPYAHE